MPSVGDTAEQVDDFYVRLLTRGEPRKVELGAPENDPVAFIIASIADKDLAYAGPAFEGSEIAPLLEADRLCVRTIPPAGVQAVTVWVAPRHAIAAFIASRATNSRAGEHTRRREPVLNAIPEEASSLTNPRLGLAADGSTTPTPGTFTGVIRRRSARRWSSRLCRGRSREASAQPGR